MNHHRMPKRIGNPVPFYTVEYDFVLVEGKTKSRGEVFRHSQLTLE